MNKYLINESVDSGYSVPVQSAETFGALIIRITVHGIQANKAPSIITKQLIVSKTHCTLGDAKTHVAIHRNFTSLDSTHYSYQFIVEPLTL